MSLHDIITVGTREGQVKCWDNAMQHYGLDSYVPPIDNIDTYSVAMREGGFVNVIDGRIRSWVDTPSLLSDFVFDKWGRLFTKETKGILLEGESYLFEPAIPIGDDVFGIVHEAGRDQYGSLT